MIIIYKVLLILLSTSGIYILVKGISMLIRASGGKLILEIPYSSKVKNFEIHKTGAYSIWHKGKLFRKVPVDKFRPTITNELTGEMIELSSSLTRTQINNGSTARMKLFSFHAPIGNFRLELREGASVSRLESALSSIIPAKDIDLTNYFIQIRESQPGYLVLFGVPLVILGFIFFIAGIILFATFEQWVNQV